MIKEYLEKNWEVSSYNEDTEDQLDYYINVNKCNVGDKAYLHNHADDDLVEMEIVHIISWNDDPKHYDKLIEDDEVLLNGEDEYDADTSAEFITDDDSYLIWFKYVD